MIFMCNYQVDRDKQSDTQAFFANMTDAAVKLMRTRIGLLAQPKSMRSIIDATQREQRYGSA